MYFPMTEREGVGGLCGSLVEHSLSLHKLWVQSPAQWEKQITKQSLEGAWQEGNIPSSSPGLPDSWIIDFPTVSLFLNVGVSSRTQQCLLC